MATYLQMTLVNPRKPGTFVGIGYPIITNFNHLEKTGLIEFGFYDDVEAAELFYPPVVRIAIQLTPNGTPAITHRNLLHEGSPAVYGEDPVTHQQVIVTPAVEPVYSDPIVDVPAMPGFNELIMQNIQAFMAIMEACHALALSRPEFSGAQIVTI